MTAGREAARRDKIKITIVKEIALLAFFGIVLPTFDSISDTGRGITICRKDFLKLVQWSARVSV